ncbi:ATP-dependent Clp protease proteolytic subunit-related protein 4, chloroplastic [Glycine soja]|uniref:ATP-dependent Clp protease proteolytic subunit n=1 Tax=Glycine soja TaxID=3848 RepID=A0A445G6W8_GLYSO|nr:ATP-dependent Clp protease proteolytic subunit-related protein 4, chloroplastic [Glycine soja]
MKEEGGVLEFSKGGPTFYIVGHAQMGCRNEIHKRGAETWNSNWVVGFILLKLDVCVPDDMLKEQRWKEIEASHMEGGEKLGYETEAFAIYDVMRYVKPPIFTLCVGNAWGEAALLLAAGAKGNRSALPSSTIMIRQPIARFQGQATDVNLARREVNNVKTELVKLYAKHMEKTPEQIEADIQRPKYFSPSEAVEYGIIDKVIYNDRGTEDRGVVSDLKKARLI